MNVVSLFEPGKEFRNREKYLLDKAAAAPTFEAQILFQAMAQGYARVAERARSPKKSHL